MKTLIVRTDDEQALDAALTIDASHSALFAMFFSWRGTYTKNGHQYMKFIFTNRDMRLYYKMLQE